MKAGDTMPSLFDLSRILLAQQLGGGGNIIA
jgi:hypothetical protein